MDGSALDAEEGADDSDEGEDDGSDYDDEESSEEDEIDLSNYYTKEEINKILDEKMKNMDMTDFIKMDQLQEEIRNFELGLG